MYHMLFILEPLIHVYKLRTVLLLKTARLVAQFSEVVDSKNIYSVNRLER
jgi:hypothetical protein